MRVIGAVLFLLRRRMRAPRTKSLLWWEEDGRKRHWTEWSRSLLPAATVSEGERRRGPTTGASSGWRKEEGGGIWILDGDGGSIWSSAWASHSHFTVSSRTARSHESTIYPPLVQRAFFSTRPVFLSFFIFCLRFVLL